MTDRVILRNELLSNESFVRWVEGDAGKEEALFWDQWIRENETNRQLAIEVQSQILGFKSISPDLSYTKLKWDQFESSINSSKENYSRFKRIVKPKVWQFHVAAVILVAFSTGLFAHYVNVQNLSVQQAEEIKKAEIVWNVVETDYEEQKLITLSDGSSIILGSHSSLRYPEGWVQDNIIEVELEGEAYFDISNRDEGQEFRVKTIDGIVEVLGTRFVVDKAQDQTRVVLEEGAVSVTTEFFFTHDKNSRVDLLPNQMVEFSHKNQSLKLQKVNPEVYISWTKNQMTLDNTSIELVAERIRKSFGINVHVSNPELYERSLSGTLNLKSADHFMKAISEVLEIEVQKINDTIVFGSI